jgi:hypothetical protein
VLGVLLLGVLVLELLLVLLMLFGAGGDVGVFFGEDTGNLDRNVVADHDRVIPGDADAKSLGCEVSKE